MLTIDIVIEPLRIMITALGTGVLPPDNPADRLRTSVGSLDHLRGESAASIARVGRGWVGTGADGAVAAAHRSHRIMIEAADDSAEIADLIEQAGTKVKRAADQLNALIDSFHTLAAALGPSLFTPQGIAIVLPVALDHIQRGVAVVARTQADLRSDTDRMMEIGRTQAPAPLTATPETHGAGVAIRLPDGSITHAPNERAATAVRAALSQRGVPYVWGGTTPDGFDCSGFTQWAYRQAGVELPRLAQDQDMAGIAIGRSELRPGDLAVWDGHVAMYIGNDQLVEAGDPVQTSPLRTTNAGQGFQGFYRPG